MLRHGVGGEEIRGAPLDIDALEGVVVIGHPKLIEVRHQPIVGTSSTGSAVLDDHIRVLSADAFQGLDETEVVVHIEVGV